RHTWVSDPCNGFEQQHQGKESKKRGQQGCRPIWRGGDERADLGENEATGQRQQIPPQAPHLDLFPTKTALKIKSLPRRNHPVDDNALLAEERPRRLALCEAPARSGQSTAKVPSLRRYVGFFLGVSRVLRVRADSCCMLRVMRTTHCHLRSELP